MCQHGMVRIVGGDFKMGSSAGERDEQPEHPVHVGAFCLDATEVTVALSISLPRASGV